MIMTSPKLGTNRLPVIPLNRLPDSPQYVHGIVRPALKNGRLTKAPCVFCKSPHVIAHHQDYSKPLDVMWMCRAHHGRWHRAMKDTGGGPRNTHLSADHLNQELKKTAEGKMTAVVLQSLTPRQYEILRFLNDFIRVNGYAPSFEEIGYARDLSSLATVHKHIANLQRKGYITRDYNRSRTLTLTSPAKRFIRQVDLANVQEVK